jgi:hypothetical protein
LINLIKKYFIPSKANDFQPYSLRKKAVLSLLVLILLLEGFFLIQVLFIFKQTNLFSSILPDVLVGLANSDRQKNNIGGLEINPLLQKAAQLKAQDMASKGYFAHVSPDGTKPWAWLDKAGYAYLAAGENLAVNFSDSLDVENAWMNSPSHRANILNNNFTQIGIASASGTYRGQPAMFVVQFFGRPQASQVAAQTPAVKKPVAVPAPKKVVPSPEPTSTPASEMSIIRQPENMPAVSGVSTVAPAFNEIKTVAKPNLLEKLFVGQRNLNNIIFGLIAILVLVALVLKIFIRIRIQYPKLIFNGVLILFVIASVFYLNALMAGQGSIF